MSNCTARLGNGWRCCRLSEVVGRRIIVTCLEGNKEVPYAAVIVSAEIGELKVNFDGEDDTLHEVYVGCTCRTKICVHGAKDLELDDWRWEAAPVEGGGAGGGGGGGGGNDSSASLSQPCTPTPPPPGAAPGDGWATAPPRACSGSMECEPCEEPLPPLTPA